MLFNVGFGLRHGRSSLRRKRSAAARKGALARREARAAAAYRPPGEAWGRAWAAPWADRLPPDSWVALMEEPG